MKEEIIYDKYFDKEVIDLCKCLNEMKDLSTTESCCGHLKERFMIFFSCNNFSTLAKIYRSVNKNYSDGKWELLVDGSDDNPVCQFWLRSKEPFKTYDEMNESVSELIENLNYWNKSNYDKYFSYQEPIDEEKLDGLAKDFAYKEVSTKYEEAFHKPFSIDRENFSLISFEKAYKAGYYKAKEG